MIAATLIFARSSTKNWKERRDAWMRQTKKGRLWHIGVQKHISVDSDSGMTHSGERSHPTPAIVPSRMTCQRARRSTRPDYRGIGKRNEHQDRDVAAHHDVIEQALGFVGHSNELLHGKARSTQGRCVRPSRTSVSNRQKWVWSEGRRYRGLARYTARLFILFGPADSRSTSGTSSRLVPKVVLRCRKVGKS